MKRSRPRGRFKLSTKDNHLMFRMNFQSDLTLEHKATLTPFSQKHINTSLKQIKLYKKDISHNQEDSSYSRCCTNLTIQLTLQITPTHAQNPKMLEQLPFGHQLTRSLGGSDPLFNCRQPWPSHWAKTAHMVTVWWWDNELYCLLHTHVAPLPNQASFT